MIYIVIENGFYCDRRLWLCRPPLCQSNHNPLGIPLISAETASSFLWPTCENLIGDKLVPGARDVLSDIFKSCAQSEQMLSLTPTKPVKPSDIYLSKDQINAQTPGNLLHIFFNHIRPPKKVLEDQLTQVSAHICSQICTNWIHWATFYVEFIDVLDRIFVVVIFCISSHNKQQQRLWAFGGICLLLKSTINVCGLLIYVCRFSVNTALWNLANANTARQVRSNTKARWSARKDQLQSPPSKKSLYSTVSGESFFCLPNSYQT